LKGRHTEVESEITVDAPRKEFRKKKKKKKKNNCPMKINMSGPEKTKTRVR